jgi:hypothetical protein
MASSFEMFKKQIDEAVEILADTHIAKENGTSIQESINKVVDTQSLTERCEDICEQYKTIKPTIRIVHHLASSGGTLVSKCLAAMPNTFVLSEVHPYSNLHMLPDKSLFLPNDIMTQCKQAGIPQSDKLADEIFLNSVKAAHKHTNAMGGVLVLRDHSHSDFCLGENIRGVSSLVKILQEEFRILSVVTIRNPIDAFISMQKSRFLHFSPQTYAEYCVRVEAFLKAYKHVPIYLYEDFTANPYPQMEMICKSLEVEFNEMFEDMFSIFRMSGDSGRVGTVIANRKRADLPENFDFSAGRTPELSKFYNNRKLTIKNKKSSG